MDVLQIIKSDHAELKRKLGLVVHAETKPKFLELFKFLVSDLRLQLKLEGDYLHPELGILLNGSSSEFLSRSQQSHKSLVRKIGVIEKGLKNAPIADLRKSVEQLAAAVNDHLVYQEAVMMPRLRERMPTPEREDLGAVILDVKEAELSQRLAQ